VPTDLPNYNPAGAPSQLALDGLPAESVEETIAANAGHTEAQLT
jgi:hypothetical protein